MKIARQIVVFGAPDLTAESTFWAGLSGGTVDADDDWHTVHIDGTPRLGIQLSPDHVPPEWPVGHRNRFTSTEGYQVYADPAGHPFCLCWG